MLETRTAGSSQRGAVRDTNTLLDESGVIVACAEEEPKKILGYYSVSSGEVAFEQRNVEVPKFWSQLATNVVTVHRLVDAHDPEHEQTGGRHDVILSVPIAPSSGSARRELPRMLPFPAPAL